MRGAPPIAGRLRRLRSIGRIFRGATLLVTLGLLGLVAAIVLELLSASWASLVAFGPGFLSRQVWDPTHDNYGALPAIVGTLLTSGLALVLAVPVALGVAVFLSEFAPPWLREPLSAIVDLSAAVPSVVYGLWGVVVLAPLMSSSVEPALSRWTGGSLVFGGSARGFDVLTAGVILAVMIVPTVTAVSRAAMQAVPRVQREAALSLGTTRTEATRLAVLGPARIGIAGGILLGLGRALGEAIAVTMVIGNVYAIPSTLFSPGQTIASLLAQSLTGAGPTQRGALVELGVILFLLALAVNVFARWLVTRAGARRRSPSPSHSGSRRGPSEERRRIGSADRRDALGDALVRAGPTRTYAEPLRHLRRRRWVHRTVTALTVLALLIAVAPLAAVVVSAAQLGGAAVVQPSFYVDAPPAACHRSGLVSACPLGGIGPEIEGTLILLAMASLIAVPFGLLAGIYLSEYGRGRLAPTASFFADVMTGFPSILIGLFIYVAFLSAAPSIAFSALSGALALSILMIPIIARATEVALRAVPTSVREAALALGFPRHRVTLRVVLGNARNGLITGLLLAVARAGGETAALIMTAFGNAYPFQGIGQPTGALPLFIYQNATTGVANLEADAWGAALVLIVLMLGLSLASRYALRSSGRTVEAA